MFQGRAFPFSLRVGVKATLGIVCLRLDLFVSNMKAIPAEATPVSVLGRIGCSGCMVFGHPLRHAISSAGLQVTLCGKAAGGPQGVD